jgi:hypothetical protein
MSRDWAVAPGPPSAHRIRGSSSWWGTRRALSFRHAAPRPVVAASAGFPPRTGRVSRPLRSPSLTSCATGLAHPLLSTGQHATLRQPCAHARQDVSDSDTPRSIDFCPCRAHSSRARRHGCVGSALAADFELMAGRSLASILGQLMGRTIYLVVGLTECSRSRQDRRWPMRLTYACLALRVEALGLLRLGLSPGWTRPLFG